MILASLAKFINLFLLATFSLLSKQDHSDLRDLQPCLIIIKKLSN